jgi:hypothetical protein
MMAETTTKAKKYTYSYADIEQEHEAVIDMLRDAADANPDITPEMMRVLNAFWIRKVNRPEVLMVKSGISTDSIKGWLDGDFPVFKAFWNQYREVIISFWAMLIAFEAAKGSKPAIVQILEDLGTIMKRAKGPAPSDNPMATADQLLDGFQMRADQKQSTEEE